MSKNQMLALFVFVVVLISVFVVIRKKNDLMKKVYTATNAVEGNYKTISLEEVNVLLDVRKPEELKADGYILGSKNIPLGDLEARMNELDKNAKYITFCAVGGRSQKAAALLANNGFTDILNAKEGMKTWPYEKATVTE
ncbi:MAG: rhodanese-like domain-containing protein [Fusobacteriaceae bacterium]